ncbi:MAG: GNAT family N-acetyltransferase [Chloroflexota bacterium]
MDLLKTQTRLSVRRAIKTDRQQIANLTHFGSYIHSHLGWASPLEWLGQDPFLVLEKDGRIAAALACPSDSPGVAWLQLFAVSAGISTEEAWGLLWPKAQDLLEQDTSVIVLPLQLWFRDLIRSKGFSHFNDVIMLMWENQEPSFPDPLSELDYHIRPMTIDDLSAVHAIDAAAFDPVWQHSSTLIGVIFKDVKAATVVEDSKGIMAYQMSTEYVERGHLARVAVHPRAQRMGVGTILLQNLIQYFHRRGIYRITVNTQAENSASRALYQKLGFKDTDEIYTTYRIKV